MQQQRNYTCIDIINSDLNIKAYGHMKENIPICAYFYISVGVYYTLTALLWKEIAHI